MTNYGKQMKKIKSLLLIIVLLLILASCKKTNTKDSDISATTIHCENCSDKLQFNEKDSLFSHIEYLQIEITDSCIIDAIKQVEISDTLVFILDRSNHVYKFSKNSGKFISQIGNKGQGPEEFLDISSFFIKHEEKSISFSDVSGGKLIKYNFDGQFITSSPFGRNSGFTETAMYSKDNAILFYNCLAPSKYFSTAAYAVSKLGTDTLKELMHYHELKVDNYAVAFSKHPMTYSDEGIDFIMPIDNHIYQYRNGQVKPRYKLEFSGKTPDIKKVAKSDRDITLETIFMAMDNTFPCFTSIFETSNKLLLNSFNNTGTPCFFYADRTKMEGSYYNYATTPLGNNPVFEIIGVSGKTFIAKLDADLLISWKENYKDLNEISNSSLRKIIQDVRFEDNPCLIFYH
jgi:hypothetical protein